MDALPLKPETAAQLEELARLRGRDPVELGGAVLEEWITQEQRDFEKACRGIEEGHQDFLEGRSRPAREVFDELRQKYGIPR